MKVFDEDHNGQGSMEDVIRVMKKYGREEDPFTDQEIAILTQKLSKGVKLTLEEETAALESIEGTLPKTFDLKQSTDTLYNL